MKRPVLLTLVIACGLLAGGIGAVASLTAGHSWAAALSTGCFGAAGWFGVVTGVGLYVATRRARSTGAR